MSLKIAIILVILTGTTSVFGAELLPLAPGNRWTYRASTTGESFTVEVGTQVYLNQRVYHTLRGYVNEPLLVRASEHDSIVYWDEEKGADILLISFERPARNWWEAPRRECRQEGQTQEERARHEGPSGRWDVVQIEYRTYGCADVGAQSEQFTENIGMVRRVVSTIAGPRTFDLVHARLGAATISAGNAGSFSVTAVPAPVPGFWLATLRLDVPTETPLTLHFFSGQEYDLRLRDSRGNILWAWSADKLFAQVVHDIQVQGGYSATVEVPHPPAIPEGPHFYALEAWLTNAGDEPQFAAVTGVDLPRTLPETTSPKLFLSK
jgi:hypothetical protein